MAPIGVPGGGQQHHGPVSPAGREGGGGHLVAEVIQLLAVPPAKPVPAALGVLVVSAAQGITGGQILPPRVPGAVFLADPARPEAVDQHAVGARRRRFVPVDATNPQIQAPSPRPSSAHLPLRVETRQGRPSGAQRCPAIRNWRVEPVARGRRFSSPPSLSDGTPWGCSSSPAARRGEPAVRPVPTGPSPGCAPPPNLRPCRRVPPAPVRHPTRATARPLATMATAQTRSTLTQARRRKNRPNR